jgi:ribosomal-protein-alanine N-acetyltransferase
MYGNEFRNVDNVRRYIETLIKEYGEGKYRSFAIADRQTDKLIGMITLDVDKFFPRAELSYWIEKSYRNKGYATEAVNAIIEYGFLKRRLNRIQAMHFSDNPASGRVLEKSGMLFEGTLRQYVGKDDIFFDCQLYAILRSDYLQITEE